MNNENAIRYLLEALAHAEQRRGFCAPNPSVGAVLVKDGQILGYGAHQACGTDHAEVVAIKAVLTENPPETIRDATLYITLEPCCHTGRTPPCTDLIIQHKLSQVIYAVEDPNPRVAGQGRNTLLAAGIACQQVEIDKITAFYKSYQHWIQTGRPWVTAKLAISLDGKIAGANSEPISITGPELKTYTHQQRKRADAILTTTRTIKADNPQMNARLNDEVLAKPVYILDSQLSTPLDAQIFSTASSVILFHSNTVPNERVQTYTASNKNIQCISISKAEVTVPNVTEALNLTEVLSKIGQAGIHDLWVEAGGTCFESLLHSRGYLHRALLYIAPKWLGPDALSAFTTAPTLLTQIQSSKKNWFVAGDDIVLDVIFNPLDY